MKKLIYFTILFLSLISCKKETPYDVIEGYYGRPFDTLLDDGTLGGTASNPFVMYFNSVEHLEKYYEGITSILETKFAATPLREGNYTQFVIGDYFIAYCTNAIDYQIYMILDADDKAIADSENNTIITSNLYQEDKVFKELEQK